MKKSILAISALAAMLFAGCTSSDELTTLESIKNEKSAPEPIQFGTYMGKAKTTRGVNVSNITTSALLASEGGFGVFAYHTLGTDYVVGNPGVTANFMYNQNVTSADGTTWTYSPIKYWPNETSTSDAGGSATSENNYGKVSFFAYGPYQDHASLPSTGIIGMTANNVSNSDVIVTYKLPANAEGAVDLLWGTAGANSTKTIGGSTQVGKTLTGGKAAVNVDMTKTLFTSSGGAVDFLFKHALAKIGGYAENNLGGIWIALDINDDTHSSVSMEQNAQGHNLTLVTVKEVQIQNGVDGSSNSTLYQQGTLNLATGVWTPTTGQYLTLNYNDSYNDSPTVYLNSAIAEPTSGLDFDNTTDHQWEVSSTAFEGVTTTLKQVYTSDRKPFYIIPTNAEQKIKVRVKYVVRTFDANLSNNWSEVEQNITKVITVASPGFLMNNQYRLNIYLGLTSIKFTASVVNWGAASAGDPATEVVKEVDLPINVD